MAAMSLTVQSPLSVVGGFGSQVAFKRGNLALNSTSASSQWSPRPGLLPIPPCTRIWATWPEYVGTPPPPPGPQAAEPSAARGPAALAANMARRFIVVPPEPH